MNVWNRNMSSMEKLSEALDLDMTSCRRIFRLAREALEAGLRVIITTTTHMKMERGIPLLADAQPEAVAEALTQSPIVMTGCRDPKNPEKISGVSEEMLQAYEKLANLVLVEADGAKMLPLKAHAEHEPVIPECASSVVCVAGIDGVGSPVSEICHRPDRYAELAGISAESQVTPEAVAAVLNAESLHDILLINKVEDPVQWRLAERIALRCKTPVVAGSLKNGEFRCLR